MSYIRLAPYFINETLFAYTFREGDIAKNRFDCSLPPYIIINHAVRYFIDWNFLDIQPNRELFFLKVVRE